MRRSGLITKKIGMTRLFDAEGRAHGVTVLAVGDCAVIGNRTMDKHGYTALVLGMSEAKEKHVAKPQVVAAKKDGVKMYRKICEFRITDDCMIPIGTAMSADHFAAGCYVDVQGASKGKGFQGAMKRHNFSGDSASRGSLKTHRSLGSIGNREWPGKVFKGRKMAGQMGGEVVSVQNLKVFGINTEDNLIYIDGAVPGAKDSFIMVQDAVKKELSKDLPLPTRLPSGAAEKAAEAAVEPAAEEKPENNKA